MLAFGSRSERAIPSAEIDVGGQNFDAVRPRIAHQLGRLVKTHRLAVEDGGAEHVGIAAFDPGRGIDQERKARGMAFRESVFAKALDLLETTFGKSELIAAADHAVDEFVFEEMNGAVVAEGRH